MEKKRIVIIAVLLMLSVLNYTRISGTENIRAIEFLSIFTIGALSGLLFNNLRLGLKKEGNSLSNFERSAQSPTLRAFNKKHALNLNVLNQKTQSLSKLCFYLLKQQKINPPLLLRLFCKCNYRKYGVLRNDLVNLN